MYRHDHQEAIYKEGGHPEGGEKGKGIEKKNTDHINLTPGKSGMKVGSSSAMLLKFIPLQTTGVRHERSLWLKLAYQ